MPDFSIADILARGYQNRKDLLAQPYGISNAAPAIGNLVNTGVQVADQNRQKQSVMQAQSDYASYLATDPNKRDPALTQKGLQAALALGYNPLPASHTPKSVEADAAAKARGAASVPKAAKTDPYALTPEEDAAWQKAIKDRKVSPTQIASRGPKRKDLAKQFLDNPSYDASKSEIAFKVSQAGQEASERLTQGGSAQVVARVAQSAREQLDALQEASDKFPRADLKFMNTPIIKLAAQGSPGAQDWLIAIQTARAEYATALNRGNSPSETQIKEAEVALPDTIPPKLLPSAIKQLRKGLDNTVKGMMTPATANASAAPIPPHPQDSEAVAWAKANPKDPRSAQILDLNGQ